MWFKIVFAAAFAITAMIAGAGARASMRRHGGGINQLAHEVRGLVVFRAFVGVVFYAALIGWLFDVSWLRWAYFSADVRVRVAAAILLVPTIVFFAWSFAAIGTNYRGGVGLHAEHSLVTSGPYRYVRHPIYVAFITLMVLVMGISGDWLLGISGLVLVITIAMVRIPIEERELAARFGTEWLTYTCRTGMIVPRISSWRGER